jgi:hypothetical protein
MRARGAAWVVGAVAAARVHPVVRVRGATARPPPAPAAPAAGGGCERTVALSPVSVCRVS